MSETTSHLSNHLLIALPGLIDSVFSRSVVLICQHDDSGAMGIIINHVSEYQLGEVLLQMGMISRDIVLNDHLVLNGGPIHSERGFVLHDGTRTWESSLEVSEGLFLTTSRDILQAMIENNGPEHVLVALGCVGWSAGQIEQELAENSWLAVPADTELVFDIPMAERWQAAAGRIGVDLFQMTGYSGRV